MQNFIKISQKVDKLCQKGLQIMPCILLIFIVNVQKCMTVQNSLQEIESL